jgi:hypothetical protein
VAYRVREQTARKLPGNCQKCGREIKVGERYKKAIDRFNPKMVRCSDCPTWSRGELETGKLAPVYQAQEVAETHLVELSLNEYIDKPDDLVSDISSILEELAGEAESVKDDLQEGYDNLPESLQNSQTGETIQERVEVLGSWIDELNSWSPDEEYDEDNDIGEWMDSLIEEATGKVNELEI